MKTVFNTYEFKTWTDFSDFIKDNKDSIVGQRINGLYWNGGMGCGMSDGPIVFLLDKICICMEYYLLSDIVIYTFSQQQLNADMTLNFLYKDIPESRNVKHFVWLDETLPLRGRKIKDISLCKFSHKFEINPSTGETRPDGGDYFSTIVCNLDNGWKLCICAEAAIYDGYVDVWIE